MDGQQTQLLKPFMYIKTKPLQRTQQSHKTLKAIKLEHISFYKKGTKHQIGYIDTGILNFHLSC